MVQPETHIAQRFFSFLLRPFLRRLARPSLPSYRGQLTLPGLEKEVRVFWQEAGIPHVFAASERDLFFAQGYLHAQERLWQMDLNRRFLSGGMAEILGRFSVPWRELTSQFRGLDSVDADYFMRLIGIRRAAISAAGVLGDDDWRRLQSYSEGVNRFIERCGKRLPLEFRLLRYQPDPWRPEDTLTIGKGFALLLSLALFTRLNAIAMAAKLAGTPEKLRELYAADLDADFPLTRGMWDATQNSWRFSAGLRTEGGPLSTGHGSNAWVLGPGRCETGNAILCNDPHLRMTVPPVWYLMHLQAAPATPRDHGYEVWGASVPGCPGVQTGHNRWIAWGVTAALCDDVEIYREKIHRVDPDRYQVDGQWRPMERRREIIRIRNEAPVERILRWTRHGPVISDFNRRTSESEVLSLRWTAHDPGEDFHGIYSLNRASDWPGFLDALSHLSAPPLNFVYADQSGNIGFSLAGKVPVRGGQPSILPLEGWRSENEWRGFLSFRDLPRLFNPPEGIIATANNQIVDSAYPHYLSAFFEPPYRARRIHELLAARPTHSTENMAVAQRDVVSLHARELLKGLKAQLTALHGAGGGVGAAAERLLRWDGECGAESTAATIFHVFHHRLMKNLLTPTLGEELFASYVEIFNQSIAPVERILRHPASPWLEGRTLGELVRTALTETCAELEKCLGADPNLWQWGRLHGLTLDHAFSRVGFLRPLFSAGSFPIGGDNFTINLGFYRHSNPYRAIVGPSLRMIVETGQTFHSKFSLPVGQSGHPFSQYYRDQTSRWQSHGYVELGGSKESVRAWPLLSLKPTG
jgi:penicillin amidase